MSSTPPTPTPSPYDPSAPYYLEVAPEGGDGESTNAIWEATNSDGTAKAGLVQVDETHAVYTESATPVPTTPININWTAKNSLGKSVSCGLQIAAVNPTTEFVMTGSETAPTTAPAGD